MKITRKQLVDALCDVLDGWNVYEIKSMTGLDIKRCKEIIKIRDGVRKTWLKAGE